MQMKNKLFLLKVSKKNRPTSTMNRFSVFMDKM